MCACWLFDQPEVYDNPLFIAALDSVTSRLLTTSQAAKKFGIRESALIAAISWCDVEQRCASVPTSSAVAVSTSSLQVDYRICLLKLLAVFPLMLKKIMTCCVKLSQN